MIVPVFSDGADSYTVRTPGDYALDFLGGADALAVNGGTSTVAGMGDGNDRVKLVSGLADVDGEGGADRFDVWAADARVSGGEGADLFNLRGGADQSVDGGDGNDRVNFAAPVTGVSADLGGGDDVVVGYGFAVTGNLHGGDGNDCFLDFAGSDALTLYGGSGDDLYRAWGDQFANFVERAGEGVDSVQLARGVDFTIPANIEKVVVGNYSGRGDGAAAITGNDGDNRVLGSGNVETIDGLSGNDHLYGKGGDDTLSGGSGNDLVDGGVGNDVLSGNDGDDILNGRSGDDRMAGGAGNDAYYVDTSVDFVTENAGEGTDTIWTTVDLTLPDNVENAVAASSAGRTIYGNLLDNHLFGGAGDDCIYADDGNDIVSGGAGNDYLGGELGNDKVLGGAGNDYVFGDEGDDRLLGNVGDDYLQGYTGNDVLDGGSGGDLLAGGTGADRLTGGAGADTFFFYDSADSTVAAPDWIRDFTSAQAEASGDDQIDLSLIDANLDIDGDQAFAGIGPSAAAHALWYSAHSASGGAQDWTFYGDTDGDPSTVEFELHVHSLAGAIWLDDVTL